MLGGAGYVGSALVPKLLERGFEVLSLDFSPHEERVQMLTGAQHLAVVRGDFRDEALLAQVMANTDAVVHLGAVVGDAACERNPSMAISVNIDGTRSVAAAAKACGVRRFVFASTCAVYGHTTEIATEESRLNPTTLYTESKVESERLLRELSDENFRPTILRFGSLYGLSGRKRFDLVINRFASDAKTRGKINVNGGTQCRPFIHVDDVARGICKVLEAPQSLIHGQVYNVGSDDQNFSVREVANIVCTLVPNSEVVLTSPGCTPISYIVSFHKIREQLRFIPAWTVQRGITQVLNWVSERPQASTPAFLQISAHRSVKAAAGQTD